MPRPLSPQYRLQGLSLPEITRAFDRLALDLGDEISVNGRRMKSGPLLNAIVLEYMAMPREEQRDLALRGIARLEEAMAQEKGAGPAEPEPPPKRVTDIEVKDVTDPAASVRPAKRKKRR